jgi:hypothetical protein
MRSVTDLFDVPLDQGGSILLEGEAPGSDPVVWGRGGNSYVLPVDASLERLLAGLSPTTRAVAGPCRGAHGGGES